MVVVDVAGETVIQTPFPLLLTHSTDCPGIAGGGEGGYDGAIPPLKTKHLEGTQRRKLMKPLQLTKTVCSATVRIQRGRTLLTPLGGFLRAFAILVLLMGTGSLPCSGALPRAVPSHGGRTTSAPTCPRPLGVGIGYVYGQVSDSAGVAIPNATVTIPGLIVTNKNGMYKAKFVSDMTYSLTASAKGYVSQTVQRLLRSGTLTRIDFVLVRKSP